MLFKNSLSFQNIAFFSKLATPKKLLLLLFLLCYASSFAQLDREHWFAPMYDGQSFNFPEQYLHISTSEINDVKVDIYSNNIIIAQRLVRKGNPAVIKIDRKFIITKDKKDLLVVGTKGLHIVAKKPVFANLRFGVENHAEIITSKGTAGLGTKFYTVVAPNALENNFLGFAASFIATEDNTTVTVDGFKTLLNFTNDTPGGVNLSSISFTLNKGQSYIIDGRSNSKNIKDGFIGATVVANKPISMTNGNFNDQYATSDVKKGSDILMDQSVPVDKLGNEFIMVKGYGNIGNKMEGAIIVSTEDNTPIYLNDSPTPVATLSTAGDYYVVNDNKYIDRGNDHYNLHIKTGKNVYVYQLLAGVANDNTSLATGGMNYIPPLNCYLPKKIDEISFINQINDNPNTTYNTKLNIITEKGATILVNGKAPESKFGPYQISSNPALQTWETYSILGVTGNITIESDKAVTAGIAAGNENVGYGGFFAGFSSIPLISKIEGECAPDVKLSVIEGFDSYRWLIKVGTTYVDAPGKNDEYIYMPTQGGIYAVLVQQGSCAAVQTTDFRFDNCPKFTDVAFDICDDLIVSPKFSLSSQLLNPSTVKIVTPPTKGIITIAADGTIKYVANPGEVGTEHFSYTFCVARVVSFI